MTRAEPDPFDRRRHPHRRPRRRGQPRSADAGRAAVRAVGAGAARHPAGHHRRGDRLRHPRQEPPQRGQLRQPRPVDGAADRRRPDPPPHPGRRGRRAVLGHRRWQRADRDRPARDCRDDADGDGVFHRRRRRHPHPGRNHRVSQRRQRSQLHLLVGLVRRDQRAAEARPGRDFPRVAGNRRPAAQEVAEEPAEIRCAAIVYDARYLSQRIGQQADLRQLSASCGTAGRGPTAARPRT